MWKISDGQKPRNPEEGTLLRDILSLLHDCESGIQAIKHMDNDEDISAAEELKISFFNRAVCVCNSGGAISKEEAVLFCDVFATLMPQFNFRRDDLQRVCMLLRQKEPGSRKLFEMSRSGSSWNSLERADKLFGTSYTPRYCELLLRMANMFASAEGVRSQQKLVCVAEIERAISPLFGDAPRKLADDIKSLFRDCENVVQAVVDKEVSSPEVQSLLEKGTIRREQLTAESPFIWEFAARSISVCNADGRVSEEEAALHHEIFIHLAPRESWVCRFCRGIEAMSGSRAERPRVLGILERNDQLNGTAYADRYRELLLRMANMLAFAEGGRNEQKLLAVAEIEKSLSPAKLTARPSTVSSRENASPAAVPARVAAEPKSLDALLGELNGLVGLPGVKSDVAQLANYITVQQLRKQKGLRTPEISLHMVFYGNPGTGKTTVARLVASIYRALGVLSKGQLIETDRSGLVAGYVGQTALKVQEIVQRAIGGVLFVDEAYALTPANSTSDFGAEAIDTLLKLMEDHRDDLVVVVAGYTGPMQQFLEGNPGLKSRFNKYLVFEDYLPNQLLQIFRGFCSQSDYTPSPQAEAKLLNVFKKPTRTEMQQSVTPGLLGTCLKKQLQISPVA